MLILLEIHSIVRWLIVIAAALAVVKYALGWLRGGKFGGMDRGLASAFSGLMDLQVLLGLIYFLWTGLAGAGFPLFRIEHLLTMLLAAVVAHLPAMWKNLDDRRRYRNGLLAILAALLLVVLGVALLPGGWSR